MPPKKPSPSPPPPLGTAKNLRLPVEHLLPVSAREDQWVVDWIADKESRDVAENVRKLDVAAATPSELNEAFLA
jgi:hypothetical protein